MVVSGNRFLLLLSPGPFKLDLLDNFSNSQIMKPSFNLKLERLSCKKVLKFVLLDSFFFDLFTEVQIWYCKAFQFGLGRSFTMIK